MEFEIKVEVCVLRELQDSILRRHHFERCRASTSKETVLNVLSLTGILQHASLLVSKTPPKSSCFPTQKAQIGIYTQL